MLAARVALRKESVDRNMNRINVTHVLSVALRKESVDRNHQPTGISEMGVVALRKESVDRNCLRYRNRLPNIPSLSARRAWIEIWARHTAEPQK